MEEIVQSHFPIHVECSTIIVLKEKQLSQFLYNKKIFVHMHAEYSPFF